MPTYFPLPPKSKTHAGERRRDPRRHARFKAQAAGIAAGVSLLASGHGLAADTAPSSQPASLSELQAENTRLRQEVQRLQSEKAAPVAAAAEAGPSVSSAPAPAPLAGKSDVEILDEVVIHARNRAEKLQDVPIPVTVVGGKSLEQGNLVTVSDFTQKVPNLLVNSPNARQTSIALRGLGKNSANDSMEASVGVIVDNVFVSHVGMTWANFPDLDHIEVARGPQGTLLGKNTTLGVLNIATKQPSFTPEYSFETSVGSARELGFKGSASGPLAENVLAYRASFYTDKKDGDLKNLAQAGETWGETNREGARFQLLATPTRDFSARVILDRSTAQERGNIQPYLVDPASFASGASRTAGTATTYSSILSRAYFGGYQAITGSRDTINTNDARPLLTTQTGSSAELNWNLADFTLTSITSWRSLDFDAKNDGDQTPFSISRNGTLLSSKGYTQEFRLTSPVGKTVDYQVGLFDLHSEASSTSRTLYGADAGAFYASNTQYANLFATGAGRQMLQGALSGVFLTTETRPVTDSLAGYGQLNWHLSERGTLTLGVRQTEEKKSNSTNKQFTGAVDLTALQAAVGASAQNLTDAKAVRASQLKNLYGFVDGQTVKQDSTAWLLNPSYKLTPDVLLYASAGYGEKSGAVQFDSKGNPANVKPEKALDFELGFKGSFFDRSLVLNLNLYQTSIKDYQANLQQVDATSQTGFTTQLSNVAKVKLQGVELDSLYTPFSGLSFNLGAAYNDAKYASFNNAVCAPEANTSLPCDYTGRQLPYAPRVTANLGVDYQHALGGSGLDGHVFVNETFRSRANINTQLSDYGWQEAYTLTDAGVGVISRGGKYELDLVGKNIFDTKYATDIGTFSNQAGVGYTLGNRRYVGLVFRSKL